MLIFADALQFCPTTTAGNFSSNVNLPPNIINWLGLFAAYEANNFTKFSASIGTLDSRKCIDFQMKLTSGSSTYMWAWIALPREGLIKPF